MLRAICDGFEEGFTMKAVLDKYRLGVSSNVVRVRAALLERDLMAQESDGRLVIENPGLQAMADRALSNHSAAMGGQPLSWCICF